MVWFILKVEFNETVIVQQITTQGGGRVDEFDPATYVTKYDFLLSNNGINWTRIEVMFLIHFDIKIAYHNFD